MEAILKSFIDPSWWFNGLFFTLVALLLPRLYRGGIRSMRKVLRNRQAVSRRKIKNIRLNAASLSYAIGRANVHYGLFLALSCGYLFVLALLSSSQKGNISIVVAVLLSIPVFIFEFAWIVSDSFVKDSIKARDNFRRRRSKAAKQLIE